MRPLASMGAELAVQIAVEADPRSTTLRLIGELDLATVGVAEKAIADAFAGEPTIVAFDLSDLTFCDSTGLRFFLTSAEEADERGVEMRLMYPTIDMRKILDLTGLRSAFDVRGSGEPDADSSERTS